MSEHTVEARLDFWRRTSFVFLGVVILGLGSWFALLSSQVSINRDQIGGIYAELAGLTAAVMANTAAQQATTIQLATLSGQLEALKRDGNQ